MITTPVISSDESDDLMGEIVYPVLRFTYSEAQARVKAATGLDLAMPIKTAPWADAILQLRSQIIHGRYQLLPKFTVNITPNTVILDKQAPRVLPFPFFD